MCLDEFVPLLKTRCSGVDVEGKHTPAVCKPCATKLCTQSMETFEAPRCPLCRRQILLDCLMGLGWVQPTKSLVDQHRASLRLTEVNYRLSLGLASHDTLTSTQAADLALHQKPSTYTTTFLAYVFMHWALKDMAPGPVFEVERIEDDSLWMPGSEDVFFTVQINFAPYSHVVMVWNGEHHGTCVRVGVGATGPYLVETKLPFFERSQILRRRERRAALQCELERMCVTRSQSHVNELALHRYHLDVKSQVDESLSLLQPDFEW